MFKFFITTGVCFLLLTFQVEARPVLLELFTSEGCSSCPEGEKVIEALNERDDFFALSFHVDYWDRLGWKDKYAQEGFTARQKQYAVNFNDKSLFTPQVVLDGQDETVASWGWRVKMIASGLRNNQSDIPMYYSQKNGREYIKIPHYNILNPADIWYTTYIPEVSNTIRAGENEGREGHYVNVVRSLEKLKTYTGEGIELELPLKPQGQKAAVFIQEQNLGPVLGLYHP
jgi:hypothetical protein